MSTMTAAEPMSVRGLLHALADDTRLEIVRRLAVAGADLPCGVLFDDIAKSTASYHFSLLRSAGVIHQYPRGTQKFNHLQTEEMEQVAPGLLPAVLAALPAPSAFES